MQSNYFLSSQELQKDKITQLSLKIKKWRLFAITFAIVTLILSSLIVSNIFFKKSQIVSKQQQFINTLQSCSDLQFSNTNLTQFSFKMRYANSTSVKQLLMESKSQPTKIISLDLSYNLLNNFSDTNLEDLQQLNLYHQYMQTVSKNNFPKLKKLKIGRVNQFSNNFFPQLLDFKEESFFFVDYFDNNYIPYLNGSRNFYKAKSLTRNNIGLTGIRFDAGSPGFQFHNNTLLQLIQFVIFCWDFEEEISSTQITDNIMPKLQTLVIDCNIRDFNQYKKFSNLKSFYLKSTSIKQFSNNSYPHLQQFSTETLKLKTFTNNNFPLLSRLQLTSSELTDMCSGNYMPNLKKVTIQWSNSLKNIDCLRSVQNLQELSLRGISASIIKNFSFPKLTNLDIWPSNYPVFLNNSFPSIKNVYMKQINVIGSLKEANISFGNSLKQFILGDSELSQLSFDKQMPNITAISVTSSNLKSLNCTTFRNVMDMIFSSNKLKDDVIDTLIDCNFTNPRRIYIQGNLIVQKNKAKSKLSSKYPNTYISL